MLQQIKYFRAAGHPLVIQAASGRAVRRASPAIATATASGARLPLLTLAEPLLLRHQQLRVLLEQLVDLCAQGALALQKMIHESHVKAGQLANCIGCRGGLRRHAAAAHCRLGAAAGASCLIALQLPLHHRRTSGAHGCGFRGHKSVGVSEIGVLMSLAVPV